MEPCTAEYGGKYKCELEKDHDGLHTQTLGYKHWASWPDPMY